MTDEVTSGTLVEYHGSLSEKHGVYRILGIDPYGFEDNDGPRYNLSKVGGSIRDVLHNVRRQSFSIKDKEYPDFVTVTLPRTDWDSIIFHLDETQDENEWGEKLKALAEELNWVVNRNVR